MRPTVLRVLYTEAEIQNNIIIHCHDQGVQSTACGWSITKINVSLHVARRIKQDVIICRVLEVYDFCVYIGTPPFRTPRDQKGLTALIMKVFPYFRA